MGLNFLAALPCITPPAALPQSVTMSIAHQGSLKYQSKGGKWKVRWFVLDAESYRLLKCTSSAGRRSKSYGSVLGSTEGIRIASVAPLSSIQQPNESNQAGFGIVTTTGQKIQLLTSSSDEELQWLAALQRLSHGFALGVCDRIANRELLAGKYALVRELGRGASGIVFLYTHQGKPFAIKKYIPQKARGIPNRLVAPGTGTRTEITHRTQRSDAADIPEEVRREIALLKKASHLPYVVQLHDVIADAEERQYYLVMEYMGGGAIAEWDPERKCYTCERAKRSLKLLPESTVRLYATNLLLGLQALHQNGLCHRDIKPENLMANEDRTTCKIGDLGVAHFFHRDETGELREDLDADHIELWDITKDMNATSRTSKEQSTPPKAMLKSTKGTYQFLPPEALSGDEFDGFKADIWSVGVTLYVLLFGYLPFYSADLVQLFEKIERDPIVFPASCKDQELKDLLLRILEKDPEKRISIEHVLEHPWLRRDVDSKALTRKIRELKRSSVLCVEASELGGAVSILQTRFDALSRAVRDESLQSTSEAPGQKLNLHSDQVYMPRPINTSGIQLPTWMQVDVSWIAAQLHYDWCRSKHLSGWIHGIIRDDAARIYPLLVPMHELPPDARVKNVQCVEEMLRCVLALGCHIAKRKCHTLHGCLLATDHVTLAWDLFMLVDLLAENSHEVWAEGYVQSGWRYGDIYDAEAKRHPTLKPYMALDESEKNLCREGASTVLKSCICLGYVLSCSPNGSALRRSKSPVFSR